MTDTLNPCPLCDGSMMSPKADQNTEGGRWTVSCMNSSCGITSGFADSEDEAIAAWTAASAYAESLRVEVEELADQRDRLAALLKATAIALKGPEPKLTMWGWSDLPEIAEGLRAKAETKAALLEKVKDQDRRIRKQREHLAALNAEVKKLRDVDMTARAYFDRYLQDEADDQENCTCGLEQHERAVELKASLDAARGKK